jgi:hypothetical protein
MQEELIIRTAVAGEECVVAAVLRQPCRPEVGRLTIWESGKLEHSLWLDFSILFRTFLRLFRPDGISSEVAIFGSRRFGAQRRLTAASASILGGLK